MAKVSALVRVERKLRSLDKWMPPAPAKTNVSLAPMSFRNFVNKVYPRYIWYRHCEVLAQVLQDVADGNRKRVMVFLAPRHGKSQLASRLFPAYVLYRHPDKFVAIASYGMELSQTFSRAARQHYLDAGAVLREDAKSVKHWETPEGGGLWVAGVGSAATGRGFGSCGLIDDPVKSADEANSETIRAKQKDWYSSVWYTRAEPNAALVVIQTRWNEDDLSGWLLAQEDYEPEYWHIVNFEAIKSDVPPSFPSTCTVEPDWRSPGDALCPERFDVAKLNRIRGKIGEYFWSALYCQQPRPLEGNLIKISWFGRFQTPPANPTMIVLSWDTASKAKELSAYSVCGVWFVTEAGFYLVDVWRDRVEMPALERMVISLGERWKPNAILIEDKASGTGVIQLVQAKAWLPIVPIEPDGDKLTRLSVESPAIEFGRVWLPEHAAWLPEFEKELMSAPNGAYMDQCDMVSQFLRWMRSQYTQFEFSSSGTVRVADEISDYLRM